jgi:hypothetical protein
MPPELARTTWGWVSLTTPKQTLTIAESERYTMRFSEGDRVALRADYNRGAAASSSLSAPRLTWLTTCPPSQ